MLTKKPKTNCTFLIIVLCGSNYSRWIDNSYFIDSAESIAIDNHKRVCMFWEFFFTIEAEFKLVLWGRLKKIADEGSITRIILLFIPSWSQKISNWTMEWFLNHDKVTAKITISSLSEYWDILTCQSIGGGGFEVCIVIYLLTQCSLQYTWMIMKVIM